MKKIPFTVIKVKNLEKGDKVWDANPFYNKKAIELEFIAKSELTLMMKPVTPDNTGNYIVNKNGIIEFYYNGDEEYYMISQNENLQPIEKSYSKEEVERLCRDAYREGGNTESIKKTGFVTRSIEEDKWIEENIK